MTLRPSRRKSGTSTAPRDATALDPKTLWRIADRHKFWTCRHCPTPHRTTVREHADVTSAGLASVHQTDVQVKFGGSNIKLTGLEAVQLGEFIKKPKRAKKLSAALIDLGDIAIAAAGEVGVTFYDDAEFAAINVTRLAVAEDVGNSKSAEMDAVVVDMFERHGWKGCRSSRHSARQAPVVHLGRGRNVAALKKRSSRCSTTSNSTSSRRLPTKTTKTAGGD